MLSTSPSIDTNSTCLLDPGVRKLSSTELSGRTLGSWKIGRVATLIGNLILALIPISFVILAILASSLNQKPTTAPHGSELERILILLPTLFPIAFAAIMGRFLKIIGLYWAERGVPLGVGCPQTLECLIGCQSLFSTVERIYFLRRTDVMSVFILLLWILSPLGGQSAVRLLTKEPVIAATNVTVRYLPIEMQANTYLDGADNAGTFWGSYAPLFMLSVLMQKTQTQPLDSLGNVKIPALDTSQVPLKDQDWQTVDYSREVHYTSLLGIPTAGIPTKGNVTFDIASKYWEVTCTQNTWLSNRTKLPDGWHRNNTGLSPTASYSRVAPAISSLKGKIPMYFTTGDPYDWPISFANCTLEQIVVDSSIGCTSGVCLVTAIRPGNQGAGSSFTDVVPLEDMISYIPRTFAPRDSGSWKIASALELWLMDPTSDLTGPKSDDSIFRNISEIPTAVLASRLRAVINTFWQSGYATSYIEGYRPANLDNFTAFDDYTPYSFNSSEAHVVQQAGENYICQWPWATLLFGSSTLLLLAACSTAVLQAVILAPDILGYASSSARDNQKVISSAHGSSLSGLEWAYRFRDIRVMVGNVCAQGEEGQIAMALKSGDQPQKLSKTTVYM